MGSQQGVNESERAVHRFASQAFLRPWVVANPPRGNGKEICDILVACTPDMVAICVKDKPPKDPTSAEGVDSWHSKNVGANVRQLYGAKKTLLKIATVNDETGTVTLPPPEKRNVRLIAVVNPGDYPLPIHSADFGSGFVHAFSINDLEILSEHLDTIPDFLDYLDARQEFAQGGFVAQANRERLLLAAYLAGGRRFPKHDGAGMRIAGDFWEQFATEFDIEAKREADAPSYIWDEIAGQVVKHEHDPGSVLPQDLANPRELALQIARVTRFDRRLLGKSVLEILARASFEQYASRLHQVNDKLWVVLLAFPGEVGQGPLSEQLLMRCIWAKLRNMSGAVLGIGLLSFPAGEEGFPVIVRGTNFFGDDEWHPDVIKAGTQAIEGHALYEEIAVSRADEHEYPGSIHLNEEM